MTRSFLVVALLVSTALAVPALAQKGGHGNGHGGPPGKVGHGNGNGNGNGTGNDKAPDNGPGVAPGLANAPASGPKGIGGPPTIVVTDNDRSMIRSYYHDQYVAGNCPPGLAKKNNGCLPPGQAKKLWQVGQPLPGSVVYYPLPPDLLRRLTPPPPGYQYIRVSQDILMMAVGTRLIASAIGDLGAM